jgi:hypothetical protein
MADDIEITRNVLTAQERMFRLAERDYGLTRKAISLETGISRDTLTSWMRGVQMPLAAFVRLSKCIPDELTSLCLEAADKHVGTNAPGDGDLDALGRECASFVSEKLEAEADNVVTPIEDRKLRNRSRRVASIALRVAA